MDFGISLAPHAESWKEVQAAEAAGFCRAWFFDSQLINADLFVAMTAAFLAITAIASWLPARRAAILDPVKALREQ